MSLADPARPDDVPARSDEPVTVRDRFMRAGVGREEFEAALADGRVLLDGERVADPATPAPWPTPVAFGLPTRSGPPIQP